MSKKQKLELTWVGKENRPRLEPRILIEDAEKSYHAATRVGENDIFDNVLIHGDNLLALKALEADYAGKVKCVFIDPPYNTGSAFTHYDDGLEHSIWLGLMRDRLEVIRRLMSEDGSLWITIDDNEAHYLKVLCDEIFGRVNFIGSAIWQHSVQAKGYSGKFSIGHNYVLSYRKSDQFVLRDLPRTDEHNVNYRNPDDDPRGPWRSGDVRNALVRKNLMYDITTPSGNIIKHPPKGWRFSKETFERELSEGKIVFSADETRIIRKIYLADQEGRVPETVWLSNDVGTTREANSEVRAVLEADLFDTPKPERLIQRVLLLATKAGDLVLDSFAGSGTTGAVAHKMGRRWIMVELGDHCFTHVAPRLRKVIDGTDQGGISKAADWKGGGGFRYYELAPSLLEKDKWGREVISKQYNAEMLAQALCKLEGFAYAPSPDVYWQQGHSSEADFLYVTTQTLGPEELAALSEDVGEGRSLLILCAAYRGNTDLWQNLTVRKIPNHIRSRCEWGHDDYSLNVANLPQAELPTAPAARQGRLFDDGEDA
ncbi:site-specific DNA-methyltransferase [Sandaracinobacter sp. RS1-74]|uniref:site-specific DNA-methyltransferase n=1 Tax=Sandaracinobacteroides sayramensis TaxID=2913411 RepID=UPI001EDAF293|nr:site-specific DNA-methyltransferase [Sandaracinobacteroides sayramensis]MCG2840772.1 site-specific DNA-methyltransferase [Sandaracinobacteroides sayramensis]